MKDKHKQKLAKAKEVFYLLMCNVVIWGWFSIAVPPIAQEYVFGTSQTSTGYAKFNPYLPQGEVLEAKADNEPLTMKEWVINEFRANGLNSDVADCVIWRESSWDDQSLPSKTNDYGLMQWNIQHIQSGLLDMSCAYNYKCAVNKAIEKIKKDGNWNAWYGYRDANCQRFGKTFK